MANRFLSNIRINDAYTFPSTDGTSGQAIVTDGAGNLSFGDVASGADSASVIYRDSFTGDGVETQFTMSKGVVSEDQTQIYIDGVYQEKDTYSVSNNVITFAAAPELDHSIEVITFSGITVGPTVIRQDNFTGDGVETDFELENSVSDEVKTMVFLNGVYQFKDTYSVSGTTLSFFTAPANTVDIEVITIESAVGFDYSAVDIDYDNTESGLVASNVQSALDELYSKKVNVTDLSANVVFYPTTASSDVTGYNKMVASLDDPDYDDTAVNVPTGSITTEDQLIASLASEAGVLSGNTGVINVNTVGRIRRTSGIFTNAQFYFKIFKRDAGGTETELVTSFSTQPVTNTDYEEFFADALLNNASFAATDRVVIKYYAHEITGTPTYDIQFGGTAPVRSLFPVPVSVIPHVNDAEDILVDTSSFSNVLSGSDDDVQTALETIDTAFADKTNWDTAYSWGDHSTQSYATETYVTTAVANLVDAAPSTLDTLNELAAALGDDPNFATTVTNSIATKLPLAGGTLTGGLIVNTNIGIGISSPALTPLHIHKSSGAAYIHITNGTVGDTATDGTSIIQDTDGDFLIRNRENANTLFYTNNLERMRIDSSGDVSIGLATSDIARLKVRSNASAKAALFLDSSAVTEDTYTRYAVGSSNGWEVGMKGSGDSYGYVFSYGDIGTASNERMRITSAGNVGIGINNPLANLHIESPTGGVLRISSSDTSVDGGSLGKLEFYSNDTSSGASGVKGEISSVDNSGFGQNYDLIFKTGRTSGGVNVLDEQMRINANGFLGIGVTNNALFFNQAENLVIGQDGNMGMTLYSATSGNNVIAFADVADGANSGFNAGGCLIYEHGSDSFITRVNGSERMRITSSGNVGIGESNPLVPLHISRDSASGENIALILDNNNNTANNEVALLFRSYVGATNTDFQIATINKSANAADLVFRSDGIAERMRITSDGNVGIGTTSPSSKLHIEGTGEQWVSVFSSNGGLNGIRTQTASGTRQNTFYRDSATNIVYVRAGTDDGQLSFIAGGSSAERMRITSGGDVLIGKTSQSITTAGILLDPNGTSEFIASGNNRTPLTIGSADDVSLTLVIFTGGGNVAGTISISGGTSTSYNTSSDYRLKENVVPMESALDRVDALKPSRFNFIANPSTTVDGFLAHEVQDIVPEAITGEKDAVDEEGNPIYQGIDQSKLVPLLTKAIQELRAEVESLKSQLNA
jgi:hypothetical protein